MADRCAVCNQRVYATEKVTQSGLVLHKACFRCAQCKRTLSTTTSVKSDNQLFCSAHAPSSQATIRRTSAAAATDKSPLLASSPSTGSSSAAAAPVVDTSFQQQQQENEKRRREEEAQRAQEELRRLAEQQERAKQEAAAAAAAAQAKAKAEADAAAAAAYALQHAAEPMSDDEEGTPAGLRSIIRRRSQLSEDFLRQQRDRKITDHYRFGKECGRGGFGVVYRGKQISTGRDVAIKEVEKRKALVDELHKEISVMFHLHGDPNVVELLDYFEDAKYVYLVMELCLGDMWGLVLNKRGQYSEADAANYLRQIVCAVARGHSLGVLHRDLKPDNFLVAADGRTLKCTDFGFAVVYPSLAMPVKPPFGTTEYLPPEALNGMFYDKSDIWACGVILFILLSGYFPFPDKKSILQKETPLHYLPKEVSDNARDLLSKMLNKNFEQRLTAQQVLDHPWMTGEGVSHEPLGNALVDRFKQFSDLDKFKKTAMHVLAQSVDPMEIEGLKAIFQDMDKNKDGVLSITEIRNALAAKHTFLNDEDLRKLIAAGDIDGNGYLDYEEFVTSTLSIGRLQKPDALRLAFREFDIDGDGVITVDELREVLHAHNIPWEDAEAQIKLLDKNNDGSVDYMEFQTYLSQRQASQSG